jgi:ABC-type transport system involved in cytochrome bd biosynthesis fused ATPase/permease subunit
MKQVVNYGVRRALIGTMSNLTGTHLPLARYQGPIAIAINDFFASLREILSAIFTQIPVLVVGFGGLITLAFTNGMTLMGIIASILAVVAPIAMYETTSKVRPGVKRATNAERQELDMLGAIFENFDMELLAPSLKRRMYIHSEEAIMERRKTSWLVRRRISEVQLISIALVVSAVYMASYYFAINHEATKSALIITVVLVLTGNLTLIYTTLDAFHNAQSRAEGFTDLLTKAVKKPPMPTAKPGKSGIRTTKNVRVTFYINNPGQPPLERVVSIPDMDISKPGLICLSAESGRGKSTFFHIVIGYLDDYSGSVTVGGYEAKQFYGRPRVGLVRQELKKVDIPITDLFMFDPEQTTKEEWELCRQILEWVGFPEAIVQQSVKDLSGGERRRALTAFGLYWTVRLELDCIILDEPTNDLDVNHILTLRDGLRDFSATYGKYVIVATHNPLLHEVADQLIPW